MRHQKTPYTPGRRAYPAIPPDLRDSLQAIPPSADGKFQYRPCSVVLKDRTTVPCVYVTEAQSYIDVWGVWPEDDKGKLHISILDVTRIAESPLRLPPQFANQLYRAGESGMGYCIFTVLFSDGTKQVCLSGNAIDFIQLPPDKSVTDIAGVIPHQGRNEPYVQAPAYFWCLYGEGASALGSPSLP